MFRGSNKLLVRHVRVESLAVCVTVRRLQSHIYALLLAQKCLRVLDETTSQLETHSELKITRRFAISAKTGAGIAELKSALVNMVPAKVVPSSYEKLLDKLRSLSHRDQPFVMAEKAQQLAYQVRLSLNYPNHPPHIRATTANKSTDFVT